MTRLERTYYQKELKVIKAIEEYCKAADEYKFCKSEYCHACICDRLKQNFIRDNPLYKKEENEDA